MSVLIKGMEMPKNCTECRFAVDGWCYAYGRPNIEALANYERTNFCPLVPAPPHGRLIDADAQIERAKRLNLSTAGIITQLLESAPTIIEAEKGEE